MTVLVKDWHWRLHLGIGLAYQLKSPALPPKYPCALVNWDIDDFYPFGGRLGLLHLRDCRGREGQSLERIWRRL